MFLGRRSLSCPKQQLEPFFSLGDNQSFGEKELKLPHGLTQTFFFPKEQSCPREKGTIFNLKTWLLLEQLKPCSFGNTVII
jgi:hypothetical protein